MAENTSTTPPESNQSTQPQQPAQPIASQEPSVQKPLADETQKIAQETLQKGMEQLKQVNVQDFLKPKEGQPPVTSEEKLWGLISYIPLMAIIPLIIKPKSEYIRLHGRQGLMLFFIFFFCIFIYIVPFIGPLIGGLIQLGIFVVGIYSLYQAFIGNWWKIPILGDLAAQIPLDFFAQVTTEALTGQPAPEQPSASGEQEMNPPQEQVPPSVPPEQTPPTQQPPQAPPQ